MIKFRFSCVLVLVTVVLWAGSASAQITSLTQGLAGCWDLNEDSGTRYDFWNNNDLTDFNTVTANPGHVNTQAAQFTASNNEYLKAADDATLHLTGDYTAGAWVYFDTVASVQTLFTNNGGSGAAFDLHNNSGVWRHRIYDNTHTARVCTFGGSNASAGQWYLALAWRDEAAGNCYVSVDNADTTATGLISWQAPDNTAGYYIGAYSGGQYLDGRSGPVFLWTRILTVSEQDWLWNSGAGRSCSEITGLTSDRQYSQDVVDLPNGRRGAIASIVTAGDISIASGILGLLILGIFWVMRDTVRSSKVGDK